MALGVSRVMSVGRSILTIFFVVLAVQMVLGEQKQTGRSALSEEDIQIARQRLSDLGYVIDLKGKGNDESLKHALFAFQKMENRPRTGILTRDEMSAIALARAPEPLEKGYTHVEIDLCRQVLFMFDAVAGSTKVLHVSTGSGECFSEGGRTRRAVTPAGRFKIIRKISGWRRSPLGLLYYPSYFYDGVAIHGNPSVPPKPASHGCVRIPMFAAEEFFRFAVIDMPIYIYDSDPKPSPPPKPCS